MEPTLSSVQATLAMLDQKMKAYEKSSTLKDQRLEEAINENHRLEEILSYWYRRKQAYEQEIQDLKTQVAVLQATREQPTGPVLDFDEIERERRESEARRFHIENLTNYLIRLGEPPAPPPNPRAPEEYRVSDLVPAEGAQMPECYCDTPNLPNVVFSPCRHVACCTVCVERLEHPRCPKCNDPYESWSTINY
jgi:hypothetical protein